MDPADIVLKLGVALVLIAGAIIDLRTRRIPNILTFGAAAAGVVANVVVSHQAGLITSGTGWLAGVAILFIPFLLRGIGGGDVKLLAAAGAWGGPIYALQTAVCGAVVGSLVALGFLLYRGELGLAIQPVIRSVRWSLAFFLSGLITDTQSQILTPKKEVSLVSPLKVYFPYGPALAIGGLAALFLHL
jgi:prepilin peptidase CpaA